MKYNKAWLMATGTSFTRDNFVFFWGHADRGEGLTKACLSQWSPCSFVIENQYYNCAEQYMMAEKARTFGDEDIRQQILAEYSQMAMKKLGRQVRGYDDVVWKEKRFDVVVNGNVSKFSQNERLMNFLISTGDKILVEASPKDTVWGIGLDEASPDAICPRRWQGENLLGFALMEVRDIIKSKIR